MELTEKHHEYWRKNLVITAILLFVWFVVTFVEAWFARELNQYSFLGFPLGFYMSAQGCCSALRNGSKGFLLMNAKRSIGYSCPSQHIGYFPCRLHWANTLSSGLLGN